MSNDSSTGGPLLPSGSLAPPSYDQALDRFLQQLVVAMTGLDPTLVEPRWQQEPANRPDINTDWAAVGVQQFHPDTYGSQTHQPDASGGLGNTLFQRNEEIEVQASFYGPNAHGYAALLRDNLQIAQNREILQLASMGLKETGYPISAPTLVKDKWYRRVDQPLTFTRMVKREFAILNLLTATIVIEAAYKLAPLPALQPVVKVNKLEQIKSTLAFSDNVYLAPASFDFLIVTINRMYNFSEDCQVDVVAIGGNAFEDVDYEFDGDKTLFWRANDHTAKQVKLNILSEWNSSKNAILGFSSFINSQAGEISTTEIQGIPLPYPVFLYEEPILLL